MLSFFAERGSGPERLDVLPAPLYAASRARRRTSGSCRSTSSTLSSLAGAINFLVTIHNLRAPGMTWMRLPLFVWSIELFAAMLIVHPARPRRGPDPAPPRPRHLVRPVGRADALLRPGRGRRAAPLPARVLVLRPPRGVRHRPAGVRDHLRGASRLRAEAGLRLQGGRASRRSRSRSSRCSCGRTTCSPWGSRTRCRPSS